MPSVDAFDLLIPTAIMGGFTFARITHPMVRKFGRLFRRVPTMVTGIGQNTFLPMGIFSVTGLVFPYVFCIILFAIICICLLMVPGANAFQPP